MKLLVVDDELVAEVSTFDGETRRIYLTGKPKDRGPMSAQHRDDDALDDLGDALV